MARGESPALGGWRPLGSPLTRQRGETLGQFGGLTDRPALSDVADLAMLEGDHLVALGVHRAVPRSPLQTHDHSAPKVRDDIGTRRYVGLHEALALFEDRPGRIGSVSSGSVSPPQMTALDAPP